ncbi:MAG: T9SS type A sorting domain-containing protein [Bacteroidota bacterium]|nr:T9SS type A sorting domain-containing protein [Bacteroidota bacterium]MDP4234878.1 T9SS type A sorting domain-containing protein [Bacteroidota bacterium]
MKFLIFGLAILWSIADSKAQVTVPVGDVTKIDTPVTYIITEPSTQSCNYFQMIDSVVVRVWYTDTCNWCLSGISNLEPPFYENDREIYIAPQKAGEFSSTMNLSYMLCPSPLRHCMNGINGFPVCSPPKDTVKQLRVTAYYDDKIKIRYSQSIFFAYDTISNRYEEASSNVDIFNNKNDSTLFTDWTIIKDSSQSIELSSIQQDSLSVTQVILPGFEHSNSIQLLFRTSLSPTADYRFFDAIVQTHAHFSGKDSICLLPVTLYFQQKPKSGVSIENLSEIPLSVFPNPTHKSAKIVCSILRPSFLHLHVYDELGKDILTVHDGMLSEGKHDFSAKLSSGMYYVRMETSEGVETKKLIVE